MEATITSVGVLRSSHPGINPPWVCEGPCWSLSTTTDLGANIKAASTFLITKDRGIDNWGNSKIGNILKMWSIWQLLNRSASQESWMDPSGLKIPQVSGGERRERDFYQISHMSRRFGPHLQPSCCPPNFSLTSLHPCTAVISMPSSFPTDGK